MVCSAEDSVMEPITDDGWGPLEYFCDVYEVWAENARDAKIFAVRSWLSGKGYSYWSDNGLATRNRVRDGMSPYAGVIVEDYTDCMLARCGHKECMENPPEVPEWVNNM